MKKDSILKSQKQLIFRRSNKKVKLYYKSLISKLNQLITNNHFNKICHLFAKIKKKQTFTSTHHLYNYSPTYPHFQIPPLASSLYTTTSRITVSRTTNQTAHEAHHKLSYSGESVISSLSVHR